MEGDGLRLHLALLHIDLVATEHDGDVLTHAHEVAMPVGHVLVGDAGGDVEHDDAALAVDVVAITQTPKLLLSCRIPHVELNLAKVGGEAKRVYLNTERSDILLLELARQVALDKGSLSRNVNFAHARIHLRLLDLARGNLLTFPVPPSPTSTSLNVGTCDC